MNSNFRTKVKRYLFIILLISTTTIFSQSEYERYLDNSVSVSTIDLRSKNLVGTSYINENMLPAKISNYDKIYSMRYNAYKDEMEFQRDGKFFYLPKNSKYTIKFLGSNKTYKIYTFNQDGKTSYGYFVILLQNDKISLLKKEEIKYIDEVMPKTGYDTYQPPTLKRVKDVLYIGYKNDTATELPKKKKDILKLFSDKSKKVDTYSKMMKLNFKNTEDLVKIFEYYNSLK